MHEIMSSGEIIAVAEFLKQFLPVCSLLASATLAIALIQNKRDKSCAHNIVDAHNIVVGLLYISSVAFICTICASTSYLFILAENAAFWTNLEEGNLKPPEGLKPKMMENFFKDYAEIFQSLRFISVVGTYIGILFVITAIGISGFVQDRCLGIFTMCIAVFGGLIVSYSFIAPFCV